MARQPKLRGVSPVPFAKASEDTNLRALRSVGCLSGVIPDMHKFVRDQLVEAHAPKEAAALKAIREQQGYADQFRDTMLQSLADAVDFKKADELIAAAREDVEG